MGRKLLRLLIITFLAGLLSFNSKAQGILTGINGTVINLPCSQACTNLNFQVPHLKSDDDYQVVSIPYTPYPYTTPLGNELTGLYADDLYSDKIALPFPICFYGSVYNQVVVGSNGLLTFDVANANCDGAYTILPIIPYSLGTICNQSSTYYPKASIMGAFSDLDPRGGHSPSDRKIEWRFEGTAPFRRFVASWYKVGVYGNDGCGLSTPTTFQIVINEATAVIEVFFDQKICSDGSNGGRAILGVQDFSRTKGVAALGKNASVWTANKEGYRFVPSGTTSRFVSSELYRLGGVVPIATATTATTTPGLLDINLGSICPSTASEKYVIRTTYSSCVNPLVPIVIDDTITINRNPDLGATVATTNTLCVLPANGSIKVNVPPGVGVLPYTFVLNPGPGQITQIGASPMLFNNVAQGTYTVVVTDATGNCTSIIPNILVDRTNDLAANVSAVATTCATSIDGKITVTPTSGSGPYTYSLDGGAPVSAPGAYTFTGVTATTHNVVVTDASGCVTNSIPVTVTSGPQLDATAVPTATSCSGASNGTIIVTPTNGTAPFKFSIDGGLFVIYAAPHTYTNVSANSHTILVSDASGCITNPIPVTIAAGPALTTTAGKTDVLCSGGSTGTITVVQPASGTPPYQYSLDNVTWQSSPVFPGLPANTYTVYFKESNGCQGSTTVTIGQPAVLASTKTTTPVVCNGQSNGIINISTTGGTIPYQYSIDGGATWQVSNIFNVPTGNYTVTIKDANNCITTQPNINVTQPAVLTGSSVNTTASCDGGADGTITINATGGNTGYQYSIDGTNFQSSNVFNVLANTYTVTVKDNLGCTFSFPTTVTMLGNLTFTPQTDPTICEGSSTQLNLVSNATQYSWTPAIGLSRTDVSNPVANPVTTTQYTVVATLGLCTVTDIVVVNVNLAPIPDAGTPGFICYGQSYTLQGSGGTQYSWTPSTYLNDPTLQNPTAAALKTITYTLSIIADANGCPSLTTDDVIVDVTPPIKVTTFPYDTIGYPMDQFLLNATSIAPNYVWTPATGLSDPNIPNPVLTVGNIGEDRVYQVTASTAAGCKGEGYVRIRVYKGPDIYVPTGFTPNSDGKNDSFYPFPVGIKSLNYFKVFNRWGQLVFSSTTLNKGWDGKLLGVDQASGSYAWMAEAVTKDNKVITKKGTVTLIR